MNLKRRRELRPLSSEHQQALLVAFQLRHGLSGHSDSAGAPKDLPGLVYFYSKDKRERAETKAVQQEIFFEPDVRAAAEGMIPIKCDRSEHAELFAALLLRRSPAVVVVDADFGPLAAFSGKVAVPKLVRAMREATEGVKGDKGR